MKGTAPTTSRVGELLAEKYRVTRFLGEGGMGAVYEAQHTVVGRRFAVKYLHAELAKEPESLERFRREARTAGALENENIVSVVDFGTATDGVPYLVMELLVGEDLAGLLRREGPLPVVRAVNVIIQACRGLDAAHAAGIIHRDLKPENLFVCRRGDGTDLVKILDFGIAKLSQAGALGPLTPVTRSGATLGTPFYMPPEQARGAKVIDARADIYSLGVILFEALSGARPHPGESYNEILYHILTKPPVAIESKRPGLHADLVALIHRAIAFEPADRPPSAAELARALSVHAGQQVSPIRSQFDLQVTRGSEPAPDARAPTESATTPPGPASGLPRRAGRRTFALAVGAAGLIVAGTLAWLPGPSTAPQRAAASAADSKDRHVDAQPTPPPTAQVVAPEAAKPIAIPDPSKPAGGAAARHRRNKGTPSPTPQRPSVQPEPPAEGQPVFDEQNPYK